MIAPPDDSVDAGHGAMTGNDARILFFLASEYKIES
jgi:hypothetical protein